MEDDFSIDEAVFGILQNMLEVRQQFFDIRFQRLLANDSRSSLVARYMLTDGAMLEMINRTYISNTQARSAAVSLLGYAIPNMTTFSEPVTVAPTQAQIQASLEDVIPASQVSCAICQEPVSSGAARIRQCGHVYHRPCVSNWFSMSVRCPVCRHDIREAGPAAQTSAASSQTSVQPVNQ